MHKDSNAENLDRIVSYPDSPDGLAYIRDTGILASEIAARMIDSNYSPGDILRAYPMLDTEDVQQALVYAVREFREMFRYRTIELRTLIASVLSSASIYLNYHDRISDERKLGYAQKVHDLSLEMNDLLDDLAFSIKTFYGHHHRISLPAKIQNFALYLTSDIYSLRSAEGQPSFEFTIPLSLPTVKWDSLTAEVILFLMTKEVSPDYRDKRVLLTAGLKDPTSVEVTVIRYASSPIANYKDGFKVLEPMLKAIIRVIQLSGSDLKITPAADHVKFAFQLPVWSENEPV